MYSAFLFAIEGSKPRRRRSDRLIGSGAEMVIGCPQHAGGRLEGTWRSIRPWCFLGRAFVRLPSSHGDQGHFRASRANGSLLRRVVLKRSGGCRYAGPPLV